MTSGSQGRGAVRAGKTGPELTTGPSEMTVEHVTLIIPKMVVRIPINRTMAERKPPEPPDILTRMERKVWPYLISSKTNKEIGAELNLSERAIKYHVSHIYRKYEVQDRREFIRKYHEAARDE